VNTQQKGQYAQLKVELRASEKGLIVSCPTVDTRYDLIIDTGEKLCRVQVKYADGKVSHSTGSVLVGLRRWAGDKRHVTRNYQREEVDAILVYLPKVDRVCWLPPELFHNKSSIVLRINPQRRNRNAHLVENFYW
jgi:hypothetical protein